MVSLALHHGFKRCRFPVLFFRCSCNTFGSLKYHDFSDAILCLESFCYLSTSSIRIVYLVHCVLTPIDDSIVSPNLLYFCSLGATACPSK